MTTVVADDFPSMGRTDLLVGMTLTTADFAIMEHRGVLALVSFVAADFAFI